ncbi:MAG: indolepyruvate oxidoreductase subunit beta [Spirochaetales bacterium]|nr:indolepyruvate oxidoreductase subunit beta [Spirochaetales bacterium]
MDKIFNVLMVGVGGQGIIMASDIFALAAMYSGNDVKKSEIHGMSQRGGSVFSHIRFGKKVYSPVISHGEADVLFSLEEMETLRWIGYASETTDIICMKTRINPVMVETYPAGIEEEIRGLSKRVFFVDPVSLIDRIENKKFLNVTLIGLISGFVDFPEESWEKAIKEKVPAGTFEGNRKAFETGKKLFMEEFNDME